LVLQGFIASYGRGLQVVLELPVYKKNMFALHGKPGNEELRAELEARLGNAKNASKPNFQGDVKVAVNKKA